MVSESFDIDEFCLLKGVYLISVFAGVQNDQILQDRLIFIFCHIQKFAYLSINTINEY